MRVLPLKSFRELDPETPGEMRADHASSWIVLIGAPILWFLQFLLNSANPKITSSALTFVPVTAGVQAQVSIPAYSVVGIALQVQ